MHDLPTTFTATRISLQRVAVHIIARRRHDLVGRFGLRATPGGLGSPAAGPEHEVVRTAGRWLVRERTGAEARTTALDLHAATLADAAAFAEVDLSAAFDVGHDTPPVGAVDAPLAVDAHASVALAAWYAFGVAVLDEVVSALDPSACPTVVQVWPEHFDAGCDVAAAPGTRVNLGASPGDGIHRDPYLYLGPWGPERDGDAGYWNAPFGAILGHRELRAAADPVVAGVAFLRQGLEQVRSGAPSS